MKTKSMTVREIELTPIEVNAAIKEFIEIHHIPSTHFPEKGEDHDIIHIIDQDSHSY